MPDWIEQFILATSTIRSPLSFRLWAGISTIAATLERRVWTVTDTDRLFPNLYTMLVGLPATGKSNALREARKVLAPTKGIFLAPDNPTKASFIDSLAASGKIALNGGGGIMYSALTVLCREFKVFVPKYDDAFFADLGDIYDNPPTYNAPRRTSQSVNIENPTLNILACATPAALSDFPESAWNEGFTSRVIFIYGTPVSGRRNIFKQNRPLEIEPLQKQLQLWLDELHGEFEWEVPAMNAFDTWINDEQMAPVPTYGRLFHYSGRRDLQTMKLSMISAVAAGRGLNVTLDDFNRGRGWLLEAEKTMPDVFRAMSQKSDSQLLQDLHHHIYSIWARVARDKREAVDEKTMWGFLETRATHDKIPGLIKAMYSTGRMRPAGFHGKWIPNPLNLVSPVETIQIDRTPES